ncbi:SPO23 (YBR250W) [Zygosaccharomyces parabailii]|uniref:ZYBA0S03-04588g1_1 n=1 Tax=Zygosaccharomyces bailii (strain CLIB 213 / ATCC 58445 / CBS 680 / BCRC 21525 / NBRC 1098 / NCYC 1416 / NRRL Y-2227) TaxID=1333698 RepID=A0A8J2T4F0_ZYGB2|nr:SPO23 (YBR250W) [Zygosaccharomyces parabailii]CDF88902.1 ZYBA0S03-04588g1_1 [Zygosaccharomyces bailii CLIB 213]
MGICTETLKTLGLTSALTTGVANSVFTADSQTKRARSSSLPSILKISSHESASSGEEHEKRHKLVKLKNLKNGGTTVRNDSGQYEYYYDPLETGNNPYTTLCESADKGYSVELKMDSGKDKTVVMPDLPIQYCETTPSHRGSSTVHLFESSSTSALPNLAAAAEGITNGGVAVEGRVVIRMKNSGRPLRLQQQTVSLKCFVEEYACFVDTTKQRPSKQVKLVKDGERDFSYLLPFRELKLDLTHMVSGQYLAGGSTYELPFAFTLKPYEFPSSVRTYFGTTAYRVESVTKIGGSGSTGTIGTIGSNGSASSTGSTGSTGSGTCFLTDQLHLKRVLPITTNIKYESVQMQGEWNKELNYNVFLSNKMIELDSPFDLHFGLLRNAGSRLRLESVVVSLSQTVAIPCVNSRTAANLPTSYLKKNDVEIYKATDLGNKNAVNASTNAADAADAGEWLQSKRYGDSSQDALQLHKLNDLRVCCSSNQNSWIRPFYCELSAKCTDRARLKITHMLNLRLTVANAANSRGTPSGDSRLTYLTFKIPILLVDSDMTMNLWLPPYVPSLNPPSYEEATPSDSGAKSKRRDGHHHRRHHH